MASLASSIGFDKREVLAYIRELSNVENVKAKAAQAAANGVRGMSFTVIFPLSVP